MSTEIEAKFLVTGHDMSERIRALTHLGRYTLLGGSTTIVEDAYLDTRDRALLSAGYVCRRREREGGQLISVKSTASSNSTVHRREELEVAISGDSAPQAWPASEARERVLSLIAEKPLEEMFRLSQGRLVRRVVDGERHVAECSLDDVQVGEGAAMHDWSELEVELAEEGTEADLAIIVEWLGATLGLQASARSKFETALDAIGRAGVTTRRGQPGAARRRAPAAPASVIMLESADEPTGFPLPALTVLGYTARERRRQEEMLTFFDTPDGAFLKQGLTVARSRSSGSWRLFEGDAAKIEELPEGQGVGTPPTVPYLDADVVEIEYQVGGMAAHLLRIRSQQWTFRTPLKESVPRTLLRIAVTGPATGCAYFSELLQSRLGFRASPGALVERGLSLLDAARPGAPFPSRFRVSPDDTVRQACSRILQGEAWRMRANSTGAIHDLDPEFVHDLRVATRRSRSALRLFSLILDPEAARSLAAELSWIASLLGATRDMDVLLARLEHYFDTVEAGPDFRRILGDQLRDRRASALSGLVEGLQSVRFPGLLGRLESCGGNVVPDPAIDDAHRGDQAAKRFARARIDKAFAKMALWTDRPVESLSDVDLHRIRILFKRLRYMCEFFRPLLGEDAGDLIGSFVGFQDCLGLHQDATTALHILSGVLAEVPPHLRSEEFLLCAGAILQVQRGIQRAQREKFARRWKSAPELVGLWKGLRGVLGATA